MNKFATLLLVTMLTATIAFGQDNEKKVSKIEKGTVLTDADLGFLSLVTNAELAANRGAAKIEANVNGKSYTVGQTLSKSDAKSINKAIKSFRASNPGEQNPERTTEKSRGGLCYYWYYYCDGYGYCYWYKYWYYC